MTDAFPDDENGHVLRNMAEAGVDLSSERIVDFEHCFPDEASAREFAASVKQRVFAVRIFLPQADGHPTWEVQCRVRIIPTHATVTRTEDELAALARSFRGYPDGWGTLSNPDGSPAT
jgi:hypothetical protein